LKTIASCDDDWEVGSVPVDEALTRMLAETASVSGAEIVQVSAAAGRVLAESVQASRDVPGHTNSAVDGYALRGADLPRTGFAEFAVLGTALAGHPYAGALVRSREAVRIMTGAVIPEGTDTVIMQEHAEARGDRVRIDRPHRVGQNVRQAGEDMRRGEVVLEAGRWLTPADLGMVASLGVAEVKVRRIVRVAVLSTGSEVCPLGQKLPPGSIYDSNRYTLMAALQRIGAEVHDLGIVPDQPEELKQRLASASGYADVIISSGGVSVGEADHVRPALSELGQIRFWKVAMKPGRPLSFGRIGSATFLGLPGNPVAVLVTFYWLVKPVLEKRMGILDRPLIPLVPARTETRLRKKPGRMEFQRGLLWSASSGEYRVAVSGKQGSGILRSMSLANALIVLPHERGSVEPDEWVTVLPFAAVV